MLIVVDGETFDVRERADRPGQYDLDWVTGPNPGYGFSCAFARSVSVGSEPPPFDVRAELERAISGFLAEIDPDTGYLAN